MDIAPSLFAKDSTSSRAETWLTVYRPHEVAFSVEQQYFIGKIWLVETEIAFSVEEQYFIGTTAGQIHFKSACAFSENFCTKS